MRAVTCPKTWAVGGQDLPGLPLLCGREHYLGGHIVVPEVGLRPQQHNEGGDMEPLFFSMKIEGQTA